MIAVHKGIKSKRIGVTVVIIGVVAIILAFIIYFLWNTNMKFKTKLRRYLVTLKVSIFWNGLIRFYL